ncbi:MAG: carbohydrate ABC transporter permease [Anaerolineae bacterium]
MGQQRSLSVQYLRWELSSLFSKLRAQRYDRLGSWAIVGLVIVFAFVAVVPLVWMLVSSFKDNPEIFANPFTLPSELRWGNYLEAWQTGLGRNFLNSVLVSTVTTPVILLLASTASYAIARIWFRGREILLWFFLSGLMIPLLLGLVPLFALLKQLKLLNTYYGLILVYIAQQLPFNVYLLYPFFKNMPRELEEAAVMDGCSLFGVFWRIMLPLAAPGLLSAAIFNFRALWNEYILALMIMSSPEMRTLPVGLGKLFFRQFYMIEYGVLFAGLVIATVPLLLAYAIFHRQVIAGMRVGALKA